MRLLFTDSLTARFDSVIKLFSALHQTVRQLFVAEGAENARLENAAPNCRIGKHGLAFSSPAVWCRVFQSRVFSTPL